MAATTQKLFVPATTQKLFYASYYTNSRVAICGSAGLQSTNRRLRFVSDVKIMSPYYQKI